MNQWLSREYASFPRAARLLFPVAVAVAIAARFPLAGGARGSHLLARRAQRGVSILIDNSNGRAQSVITGIGDESYSRGRIEAPCEREQ